MIEVDAEIATGLGTMGTFVVRPDSGGPCDPAVDDRHWAAMLDLSDRNLHR